MTSKTDKKKENITPRVSETPHFLHRVEKHWMKGVWKVEWVFCSFGSSAADNHYWADPLPRPCHPHCETKCTAVATKYIHITGSGRQTLNRSRKVLLQSQQEVTEKLKLKSRCPLTHTQTKHWLLELQKLTRTWTVCIKASLAPRSNICPA